MTDLVFWHLIAQINWRAATNIEKLQPLVNALAQHSEQEIISFDRVLTRKLYDLDTRQHAEQIGEGAYSKGQFSADEFLYARCYVVAKGEDFYNKVLREPSAFPKDQSFEELLEVMRSTYKLKKKQTPSYYPELFYETFSNYRAWELKEPPYWMQLLENTKKEEMA